MVVMIFIMIVMAGDDDDDDNDDDDYDSDGGDDNDYSWLWRSTCLTFCPKEMSMVFCGQSLIYLTINNLNIYFI